MDRPPTPSIASASPERGPVSPPRRLIVNADDFGRSPAVNQAVARAHREGILTTASLMVNEPACAEAVALAKDLPSLGVGLHLTLLRGHAALSAAQAPGLVDARGQLGDCPVAVGLRYYFKRGLREELTREIAAQFERFRATGLPLDHVNGHLHLHLHPTVFDILMAQAARWGFDRFRLTCDPLWINLRLARGRWLYRLSHYVIYRWLSARARPALRRRGIRQTERVFGLLQDGRVDAAYVAGLLARLPPGDSELYLHPSLDEARHEFDALASPSVKALVAAGRIQLIRYQDL
jgi:hopanoid biosynthesis associated protein HpnK